MTLKMSLGCGPLTVKLRGRPEALDQAPPAHTVFGAGGADTEAVHGPLQRLLGDRLEALIKGSTSNNKIKEK